MPYPPRIDGIKPIPTSPRAPEADTTSPGHSAWREADIRHQQSRTVQTRTIPSGMYGTVFYPVPGGKAISFIGDPRDGGTRKHKGYDIKAPAGAPVVATVSGEVIYAENHGERTGIGVKIRDGHGNDHLYAHLHESSLGLGLKPGMQVQAGGLIGYVGATGNAKGGAPHLHYSINEGRSDLMDPAELFDTGQLVQVDADAYANVTQGGVNPSWGGSGDSPVAEPLNYPTGYDLYEVNGVVYAVYSIGSGDAAARVFYRIQGNPPAGTKKRVSHSDWQKKSGSWVDGGSSEAFRGFPAGKSYQEMVDRALYGMGIYGSEALSDAGVLKVIAEFVARPDMTPEEMQGRLEDTEWWDRHTNRQRQWNDMSSAEQEQQIMDAAGRMAGLWFTYVGVDVDLASMDRDGGGLSSAELKKANPALYQAALDYASGVRTEQQIINEVLKPEAEKNPDSPWSRIVREEEQAQGQYDVDVSNTAGEIRDMANRWGVPLSDAEAKRLADQVMMNDMSIEDVEGDFRDQATALYPTKPGHIDTYTYSQPYRQTYMELMEVGDPGVFNDMIQSAMRNGLSLGDMEKQIRQTDQWKSTANARESYAKTADQVARMFGFA